MDAIIEKNILKKKGFSVEIERIKETISNNPVLTTLFNEVVNKRVAEDDMRFSALPKTYHERLRAVFYKLQSAIRSRAPVIVSKENADALEKIAENFEKDRTLFSEPVSSEEILARRIKTDASMAETMTLNAIGIDLNHRNLRKVMRDKPIEDKIEYLLKLQLKM